MKGFEKKALSRSGRTRGPLGYTKFSSVFVEKCAAGCPRVFKTLGAG